MKHSFYLLLASLTVGGFSSCIKEEALNAECDITRASVSVAEPTHFFYQESDTAQVVAYTDSIITFTVRPLSDRTALAPRFVLTEGATISPASGSVQDFSNGAIYYTVTSADRQWHRRYKVQFVVRTDIVSDTLKYDFEKYELNATKNYYLWSETTANGDKYYPWATGNAGFRLSMSSATPQDYPTLPETEGYQGAGVRLVTRDTGVFGRLAGRPLAAGNLFLGTFDVAQALTNSLGATRFGNPTNRLPLRFSGYYKYAAGEKYQNKSRQIIITKQDFGHIYALLYRNHDAKGNAVSLDGNNVLSSDLIIGWANLDSIATQSTWTHFDIPFRYTTDIDEALLANYGYSLAIVLSSSRNGSLFEGAIGSTLWIDQLRITCNTISR